MSDFLTLVQQLQREVGVAGSPISTVLNQTGLYSKLVNWITDADEYLQGLHIDWKFLWKEYSINTIVGNAEPTIPSDLNVWDQDKFYLDYSTVSNKSLKYLDYTEWKNGRGRGVLTNRKPNRVVIKPDNQIILSDPPDDVYALTGEYWHTPVKMTANTDVSAIPVAFHRIIVVQAKLWYAEQQEIPAVYKAATLELYGDRRKNIGLLGRLESLMVPGQEARTMGKAPPITIVPE